MVNVPLIKLTSTHYFHHHFESSNFVLWTFCTKNYITK